MPDTTAWDTFEWSSVDATMEAIAAAFHTNGMTYDKQEITQQLYAMAREYPVATMALLRRVYKERNERLLMTSR